MKRCIDCLKRKECKVIRINKFKVVRCDYFIPDLDREAAQNAARTLAKQRASDQSK